MKEEVLKFPKEWAKQLDVIYYPSIKETLISASTFIKLLPHFDIKYDKKKWDWRLKEFGSNNDVDEKFTDLTLRRLEKRLKL